MLRYDISIYLLLVRTTSAVFSFLSISHSVRVHVFVCIYFVFSVVCLSHCCWVSIAVIVAVAVCVCVCVVTVWMYLLFIRHCQLQQQQQQHQQYYAAVTQCERVSCNLLSHACFCRSSLFLVLCLCIVVFLLLLLFCANVSVAQTCIITTTNPEEEMMSAKLALAFISRRSTELSIRHRI